MNREIPGFYFDKEKNRYFKIKSSATAAPSGAAYTTDNVRKRKAEAAVAAVAAKRQEMLKTHIRRAAVLDHPLVGARLLREFGVVNNEMPVESWTSGLRDKGAISFHDDHDDPDNPSAMALSSILVNGDDQRSGMGIVYAAALDRPRLAGCYIPTDKDGRVNYSADPLRRRSRRHEIRVESNYFNSITSINYHAASHHVVLTSRLPASAWRSRPGLARMILFSPTLSPSDDDDDDAPHVYDHEPRPHPSWLIGETDAHMDLVYQVPNLEFRNARLAPPSHGSSALVAIVATNQGMLRVTPDNVEQTMVRVRQPSPHEKPRLRDVLSVDWHPTQPAIAFSGQRDGRLFKADSRASGHHWGAGGWEWFRHRSSVAQLRCLDDHRVLAAGPRGAMAVYDLRWLQRSRTRGKETTPVVRMNEYRSGARTDLGMEVETVGGGLGKVVAAGMDDGTVGVFSLGTGRRLRAGAVDEFQLGDGGVVKCLQWERMPWENDPSLWVGAGAVVKKFSYGLDEGEDGDS